MNQTLISIVKCVLTERLRPKINDSVWPCWTKMTAKIVSGRWTFNKDDNNTQILFVCRTENGREYYKVTDFQPYFYIKKNDYKKNFKNINKVFKKYRDSILKIDEVKVKNGNFVKITTTIPSIVKLFREELSQYCEVFEADVPFVRRFLIDNDIKLYIDNNNKDKINYRLLYIDIECDAYKSFPSSEKDKILCIGTVSDTGEEKWFDIGSYKGERPMLSAFKSYLKDYDVIIAWNGKNFDFPYIWDRMIRNGVIVEKWKWRWFDLFLAYKRSMWKVIPPLQSYSLDFVSKFELGEGKIEALGNQFGLTYMTNKQKAKEYNMRDCRLMRWIDDKRNVTRFFELLSEYSGIFIDECITYSQIIDCLMLRRSYNRYIHKSKRYGNNVDNTYEGAIVISPEAGIYHNIIVFDYKALYPSIMRTFNLSFDTLLSKLKDKCIKTNLLTDNGLFFRSEKGIAIEFLDNLNDERYKYKKKLNEYKVGSDKYREYYMKQYVVKVISNTTYGYFGYSKSRVFDPRISSTITRLGRELITLAKKYLEDNNYKVVYGDTDSVMFVSHKDNLQDIITESIDLNKKVNQYLSSVVKKFSPYNYINLEFEKVLKTLMLFSKNGTGLKKKYVYQYMWNNGQDDDSVKVSGLELIRGDWSDLAKKTQRTLLNVTLKGSTFDEVKRILLDIKKSLFNGEYDNSLMIFKSVKIFEEYKVIPTQARLAKRLEIEGVQRYRPGDKIGFISAGYKDKKLFSITKEEFAKLHSSQRRSVYEYYYQTQVLRVSEIFVNLFKKSINDIDTIISRKKIKFHNNYSINDNF